MKTFFPGNIYPLIVVGVLVIVALLILFRKKKTTLEISTNIGPPQHPRETISHADSLIEAIREHVEKERFAYYFYGTTLSPMLWAVVTRQAGVVSISVEMTADMPNRFMGMYESIASEIIAKLTGKGFAVTFSADCNPPPEDVFI